MVSKTIWLKYIINKFKGSAQGLFVFDNWIKLYGLNKLLKNLEEVLGFVCF